ncbi:hypothetical protein B0H16DRAFT_1582476 [Mycena metata]|uniref:Uncharacterized protein n=1 Tax=Mycena metata TaxID=1033252 RepID=A0AAD7I1V6_9AGAR|nr:hypothetical protein B0H16DRAFT_1582476 [Mycena metata]
MIWIAFNSETTDRPSSKFSYFLPRGLVVLPTFFFVRSPTTSAAAHEILSPRHAISWSGERRHRGFSAHSSISALFFMSFTPRYTPQSQPRCMRFQTVAHRQDPGQPSLSLDGWRKCATASDNHITTGFEVIGQKLPIWSGMGSVTTAKAANLIRTSDQTQDLDGLSGPLSGDST